MIFSLPFFRRSAKINHVFVKNFRLGRGSVVLLRIYPFVHSASQPHYTSAFANLLDLKISSQTGLSIFR